MYYFEVIKALWLFIKEISDNKKGSKELRKKATLNFVLSIFLIASLVFNLFLFTRVFSIAKHYMELHAVDSRTIKLLTEAKQKPPVKLPDTTNPTLPKDSKPPSKLKEKEKENKHTEKRVNNLKNRFDKIKDKED